MEFQGAMLIFINGILLPEVLVFSTYCILALSQKKKSNTTKISYNKVLNNLCHVFEFQPEIQWVKEEKIF